MVSSWSNPMAGICESVFSRRRLSVSGALPSMAVGKWLRMRAWKTGSWPKNRLGSTNAKVRISLISESPHGPFCREIRRVLAFEAEAKNSRRRFLSEDCLVSAWLSSGTTRWAKFGSERRRCSNSAGEPVIKDSTENATSSAGRWLKATMERRGAIHRADMALGTMRRTLGPSSSIRECSFQIREFSQPAIRAHPSKSGSFVRREISAFLSGLQLDGPELASQA